MPPSPYRLKIFKDGEAEAPRWVVYAYIDDQQIDMGVFNTRWGGERWGRRIIRKHFRNRLNPTRSRPLWIEVRP